jgi:hypothetical protein
MDIEKRVNGYGVLLRFITPILITVALFILGMIRSDLKELETHFTNHLSEHKILETTLENRLTKLETQIEILVSKHEGGE